MNSEGKRKKSTSLPKKRLFWGQLKITHIRYFKLLTLSWRLTINHSKLNDYFNKHTSQRKNNFIGGMKRTENLSLGLSPVAIEVWLAILAILKMKGNSLHHVTFSVNMSFQNFLSLIWKAKWQGRQRYEEILIYWFNLQMAVIVQGCSWLNWWTWNCIHISQEESRCLNNKEIICCFPRCIKRQLEWQRSIWD